MSVVLRLLVQAEPDTDPIEFALRAAAGLGGPIYVVNGTGKELGGYELRHDFVELVDACGRPSRSVSEIIEAVRGASAEAIGCLVVLDVSRIYRASRVALRQGESVKELSPGHWDAVNETLGQLGEELTRRGTPSIWTAPSSPTHAVDEDGRDVIVGSAPQVWRDLVRQAHAWLSLERRGLAVNAEIRGDDFRVLGQLGEVLPGADGHVVGQRLAPFVSRESRRSTTTMNEAAAAELAARARLEAAREREAAQLLEHYQELATVRALRGREHWEALQQAWGRDRHRVTAEQAQRIDQVLLSWERVAENAWRTAAAFEKTRELGPNDPEAALGLKLAGPSPEVVSSAAQAGLEERLAELEPEDVASWVDGLSHEELVGWLRAAAEALGVWSRPRLATVAGTTMERHMRGHPAGLPALGPAWERYEDEHLRNLLAGLMRMALVERRVGDGASSSGTSSWRDAGRGGGAPAVAGAPDVAAKAPSKPALAGAAVFDAASAASAGEDGSAGAVEAPKLPSRSSAADYLELVAGELDEEEHVAAEGTEVEDELPEPAAGLELPTAEAFARFDDRDQASILSAIITLRSLWSELPALCGRAGVSTHSRVIQRWSAGERETFYAFLLRDSSGLAPPVAVAG